MNEQKARAIGVLLQLLHVAEDDAGCTRSEWGSSALVDTFGGTDLALLDVLDAIADLLQRNPEPREGIVPAEYIGTAKHDEKTGTWVMDFGSAQPLDFVAIIDHNPARLIKH